MQEFNPLNAEINSICHLLVLLGAQPSNVVCRHISNSQLLHQFGNHASCTCPAM